MKFSTKELLVGAALLLVLTVAFFVPVYHLFEASIAPAQPGSFLISIPEFVETFGESDVFLPTARVLSVFFAVCWIPGVTHFSGRVDEPARPVGPRSTWLRFFTAHPIHGPPHS